MNAPLLGRALLVAVAGPHHAECVAGDLEEEFIQQRTFRGRVAATRWYFSQVARSLAPLMRLRIRSGEPTAVLLSAALGVALPLVLLDRLWLFVYSHIPLKDGLERSPWVLAINVAAVLAGGTIANPPTRLRHAAWARAAAAVAAAVFGLWFSQAKTPIFYAMAVLAAAGAAALPKPKLKRKSAA